MFRNLHLFMDHLKRLTMPIFGENIAKQVYAVNADAIQTYMQQETAT